MRTLALLSLLFTLPLCATSYTGSALEPVSFLDAPLNLRNGSTTIEAAATQTEGRYAFDRAEKKVPFLEQYGTISLAKIFTGITTPVGTHPISNKYNAAGAKEVTGKTATLRFNHATDSYRFRSAQVGLTQHLFTGLFIRGHVRLSEQRITQTISATGTDAVNADVVAFMADFDAILKEFGGPALSTYTRKATIENASIFLGWQGKATTKHSHISEIAGSIAGGYQFTPPSFVNTLAPALLPHNVSDGFLIHLNGYLRLMKHVSVDASLAATIFNQRLGTHHVVTDDAESNAYTGPVLLGTGFVKKDPGTLWHAGFNLNIDGFKGLYAQLGYQFTYQEKTELTAKNVALLSGLAGTPRVRHARLNSDPKLGNWKHHAMTAGVGFRPTDTTWRVIPRFSVQYAIPLWGHYSVHPSQVHGGSINLSAQWTF